MWETDQQEQLGFPELQPNNVLERLIKEQRMAINLSHLRMALFVGLSVYVLTATNRVGQIIGEADLPPSRQPLHNITVYILRQRLSDSSGWGQRSESKGKKNSTCVSQRVNFSNK